MKCLKIFLTFAGVFLVGQVRANDAQPLFTISGLNGQTYVLADPATGIVSKPKAREDKVSDVSFIQYEGTKDNRRFFISHNNGRSEVAMVSGERTITFVELRGDSVYLWVICLDQKYEDGSFLITQTGVKNIGAPIGVLGRLFTGRATMTGTVQ